MLLAFYMGASMLPVLLWAFLEWQDQKRKMKHKYKENPKNDQ